MAPSACFTKADKFWRVRNVSWAKLGSGSHPETDKLCPGRGPEVRSDVWIVAEKSGEQLWSATEGFHTSMYIHGSFQFGKHNEQTVAWPNSHVLT
jgi:hypothetical protein